jgi:hypothetical protein
MTRDSGPPPPANPANPANPRAAEMWGLPDWRDPAAYGDVASWDFNRWRWEFYRRRDDLRAYFDAKMEYILRNKPRDAGIPGLAEMPTRPEELPFWTIVVDSEARARFGYDPLPNPRIGALPADVIRPIEHDGVSSYLEGGWTGYMRFRGTFEEWRKTFRVALTEDEFLLMKDFFRAYVVEPLPMPVKAHEMVITFDLNRPVEPQLAHARNLLRREQSDLHGRLLQKRRHPGKWLGYLRTLDAREDGASWAEIAALHPNTAQTEQAARDVWEAANSLRFNLRN